MDLNFQFSCDITRALADLDIRVKEVGNFGKKVIKEWSRDFITLARAGCPEVTGRLKKSIGNTSKDGILKFTADGFNVKVGTKVSYAMPVELGIRRPYIIQVRDKKALRWKEGQKYKFRTWVVHPTTVGKYFMASASFRATKIASAKLIAYKERGVM